MVAARHPSFDAQVAALSALLLELRLPTTLISPLLAHANAVEREADRLGLVSRADRGLVVGRHTADSLLFALARAPHPGERWVDVGSGAGFPGLVLAICYSETFFLLCEPQQRRAAFLDLQLVGLGITNARVSREKAEELTERSDVAVARALAEPATAFDSLAPLAPEGTVLIAVGEKEQATAAVRDLHFSRPGVHSPGRFFLSGQGRASG